MSSAEQKQLLAQKLFRNLKSKQKTSKRLQNSDAAGAASIKTVGTAKESQKNHEEDLTRCLKLNFGFYLGCDTI